MSILSAGSGTYTTFAPTEPPAAGQAVYGVSPRCRVCGAIIHAPFLDYGNLPPANGFSLPGHETNRTYPTAYLFCPKCYLVQIAQPVPPGELFGEEYPFLTSSSRHMVEHYRSMAAALRMRWIPKSVLEVGCNDGGLLEHLTDLPHVGIEPSHNVAMLARAKGIRVEECFFGEEMACRLASGLLGDAPRTYDLIVANHVATHLPNQLDFFSAVDVLLSSTGVLVLEDPSLLDVTVNGQFDQYYEEHSVLYSLPALVNLLARYDLEVADAEPQAVHGGSLRVTAVRRGAYLHLPHPRGAQRLFQERFLTRPWTYALFAERVAQQLAQFKELVLSLRRSGHRLAGYGATSKSVIPLIRCGLGPDEIEYLVDSTPTKQGKLTPGSAIPIISRQEADRRGLPDYFVLFAHNHEKEILAKESGLFSGKWIKYIPSVCTFGPTGKDDA